jgi:hypothetical protein
MEPSFFDTEAGQALMGAVGMALVLLLRGAWRWLGSFVKGTPTTLDDKMYKAVQDALRAEKGVK